MNFTKQEQKVYDYILAHPECITKDIFRDTGISCPSARITYLRDKGVEFEDCGKVHYPGSMPYTKYKIKLQTPPPTPFKEIPVRSEAKQLALRLAV